MLRCLKKGTIIMPKKKKRKAAPRKKQQILADLDKIHKAHRKLALDLVKFKQMLGGHPFGGPTFGDFCG